MHPNIVKLQKRIKGYLGIMLLRRRNTKFDGFVVFEGRYPRIDNAGQVRIGANCIFRTFWHQPHIYVRENAELEIGDYSGFNDGVVLYASTSVKLGERVLIGDNSRVYDTDFHKLSPDIPVKYAPVTIGNNVWVGVNCLILAGSKIGDHSVIGAGSVVTGEIPSKCLAAGVPAKPIKNLDIPDGWLRNIPPD